MSSTGVVLSISVLDDFSKNLRLFLSMFDEVKEKAKDALDSLDEHFEEFRKKIERQGDKLREYAKNINVDDIKKWVENILSTVYGEEATKLKGMLELLEREVPLWLKKACPVPGVEGLGSRLAKAFSAGFTDTAKKLGELSKAIWAGVFDAMNTLVSHFWGKVSLKFVEGLEGLKKLVGEKVPTLVSTIVGAVGSGALRSVYSYFTNWLNGVYDTLFSSAKQNEKHVRRWVESFGVRSSAALVETAKKLMEGLLQSGFDKFFARTVAEMKLIPGIIEEMGGRLKQGQFEAMLWKISHALEQMRKNGNAAFRAWQEALPSISALLYQVEQGWAQWSDHMSAMISGLIATGNALDELLAKAVRFASTEQLLAYFTELANAVRSNSIALATFAGNLSTLLGAALERGVAPLGQFLEVMTAAKGAGWDLASVLGALNARIAEHEAALQGAQSELAATAGKIGEARAAIWNLKESILEAREALREKLEALRRLGEEGRLVFEGLRIVSLELATTLVNGMRGAGEHFRYIMEEVRLTGEAAFETLRQRILALVPTKTGEFRWRDINELLRSVNEEARKAVLEAINAREHIAKLNAQILNQRENIEKLKALKEKLKNIVEEEHNILQELWRLREWAQAHWNKIPDKLETLHGDLRDIYGELKGLPKKESGGFIPSAGLYRLHAGEYVLPRRAVEALRGGELGVGGGSGRQGSVEVHMGAPRISIEVKADNPEELIRQLRMRPELSRRLADELAREVRCGLGGAGLRAAGA